MYKNILYCPLKCNQDNPDIDTQEHVLICTKLRVSNTSKLVIGDGFGWLKEQEEIGKVFAKAVRQRTRI